jgi:hypothetical protein
MLAEQGIDAGQLQRPAFHDREGVGKGVAVASGGAPLVIGGLEEVEVIRRVHPQKRIAPEIIWGFRRSYGLKNGVDSSFMLGRPMHRTVEEFPGGRVRSLPLVPKAPHRSGM